MATVVESVAEHYRVIEDNPGCPHCHEGAFWTVGWICDDGEWESIGTSWKDSEAAEDACELMNMAYTAGLETALEAANERARG
jgi:hypothetical protein